MHSKVEEDMPEPGNGGGVCEAMCQILSEPLAWASITYFAISVLAMLPQDTFGNDKNKFLSMYRSPRIPCYEIAKLE